jgi:thiazole synthase
VDDAVRYARLGRAAGFNEFVKLEVIGDQATCSRRRGHGGGTRVLAAEGFKVMAYTNDDLVTALRLEDAGAVAVMPLARRSARGSGCSTRTRCARSRRASRFPWWWTPGLGCASDAALAMEQGVDAVLLNTALSAARDPERMARAMRLAVEAGRASFLAAACRAATTRWRPVRRPG